MSDAKKTATPVDDGPGNFVKEIVEQQLQEGKLARRLMTRFPPEPNGYLHIGHAKAITVNFGLSKLAADGVCNLRFDDTNPEAEDTEFVDSIKADIKWLGFDWEDREYFASSYFEQLYAWAVKLIEKGLAYVDHQSLEEIRENRGDFHRPGVNSPYRERSVEENLDLFGRMRAGEFDEGACVLRAKIDMAHSDLKLRDPLMYRIRKVHHHRTGDDWCIYPIYDWAHGQSDAIEGVTHSVCSLEFKNHRNLYDWFLKALEIENPPQQIEFARLNLTYTVLSKRHLRSLVEDGTVNGWDDPRMPTLSGMRRRGYSPEAIVAFCERVGVSTRNSFVDVSLFEFMQRETLNDQCPRLMAVLRPIKLTITNMGEDESYTREAMLFPDQPERGSRQITLRRELYIDRDDFMEVPMKKWFRLAPGKEVRLRYGCLVTCQEVIKDEAGEVVELRCTWDPDSLGGMPKDGRKVKGTIHWVSAADSVDAEVRLYDRLFSVEDPMDVEEGETCLKHLNPESLEVVSAAKVEPALAEMAEGARVQFERVGYFCVDPDSQAGKPVFNRSIGLRDSWAKIAKKG